jgi:hypothetical protein
MGLGEGTASVRLAVAEKCQQRGLLLWPTDSFCQSSRDVYPLLWASRQTTWATSSRTRRTRRTFVGLARSWHGGDLDVEQQAKVFEARRRGKDGVLECLR